MTGAINALVRVKSHHPDVDMAKVEREPDRLKDLKALMDQAGNAAFSIAEEIDFGKGGEDTDDDDGAE